ncbi:hypothetical protein J6590_065150 [Homalodisca vitripennis]|nr:hypothetical protein J6590_065150 [Homalodisca vitripennis]
MTLPSILLVDDDLSNEVHYREVSDDEDSAAPQTRSLCRRILRKTTVNSNTGRISYLCSSDLQGIKDLKSFSFTPDETPLLTTQLNTDHDWK